MRLFVIRHGDPDYERDSLTPRGWREAELLSERLIKEEITDFYVSPLGRARDTASPLLKKLDRTAEVCEWLREFSAQIHRPDQPGKEKNAWDWLPQDWTCEEEFFRRDLWDKQKVMRDGNVGREYRWVTGCFDTLLAKHGYVRENGIYRAERPNRDTIALFCHFGAACVLLSHLMGVSPMILWHHTVLAPSSLTVVYTEERREGIVSFRAGCLGDTSHLYAAGEKPSFAARFCETYDCKEERHD